MAVIVGGNETGLLNTSFAFSNRNDRTSQGDAGHGEQLYVNASNGNLVIQHQDVFLPSLGDDFVLARTYNARGRIDDPAKPNDGEWRFSTNIRLYVKYSGAQKYFEVEFGDGSIFDYRINPSTGLYVSTDGAGAFETIADLGSGNPPFVLTRSDGSTLNFDAQGRLTSMLDTNGVRISYVYSGDQLTQILDDTGHVLTYTYQGGLLSKVTDESQVVLVEYKYANGRLSEVIDRAGHSTKYFYAADGTLERMVLPNSQVVNGQTQTYANRELKFTYETVSWGGNVSEPFKVLSQLIDAKGNTTSFTYGFDFKTSGSSTKGTTTVVDALGNNRAYSNDAEYVQWRQANGYYQSYSASAVASSPSLQAQVDAIRNAHALTYAFREDGLITEVIDQQGFRTSYTYDAANNLVAVTDNNGWGATKSDSPYYRKVRAELGIVDASGNGKLVTNLTAQDISALLEAFTAHYEYDSRGNLTKSIDNADKETSYIYNDFNKLVSSTSASGHIAAGKASEFKDSSQPATVALLGGGYVTVFTDLRGNDGDGYGIFSQRFDAAGNHQGGPVQVNSCTINKQQAPEIVALNDGGYFVAWENLDGSGTGIFGQRFAADGMRVGSEIRLNSHTGNYQDKVSLTALVDGGFVAVWQSDGQDGSLIGVYGQRFAADGSVVGSEFQVNTYTNSNQDTPAIASLADGGFVVAWESFDQDGSADGIYAKRYAADGNVVGSEFQVNSTTSSYQRAPAVVSMTDGGFVVAWGYNDVYGQRYGADGAKVGTEFQINTYTTNTQQMPVLAEIPGGGFVAVWEDSCQDGDNWGIYAQCFGVNGNKVGAEFHVSTTTAGNQLNPTATVLADGKLVVSYESTYIDNSGVTRTEILQSVIPIVLEGSYGSPLPPGFGGRNESRVTNTGLILKQALLNQYTTYYEYDEKQNLIERRDPGGDITRFEYDASGNLIRKIVFLDANDLVTVSKQQVTTYVYDGFGQMVRSVDAEGNQALNEYDHFGNLIRHTDARGAVTTYTYDADNRLLSVIDPISFHTIYAYDAVGNRIAVTNAKGRTLTQIYDANNNLLSTLDPALSDTAKNRLTSFEYDVVGNRTAVVDAAGNRSEYVFNARRELVETVSAQVADENGTATRYRSSYAYDGRSNLISSTDNRGFTTEILYTNDNLVRQKTDPAGHITRFEYDANGNQIQIIVGYQLPVGQRQIVKFGYDEEDQQITATDAKGNITRRTYDAVGNVTSLTDANGKKTDFTYDRNNRLLREIRPEVIDPKTGVLTRYVLEHRYDQNGNTIETIDENGRSTKFTFDRENRMVMVVDANNVTTVLEYDSLNNRTAVMVGVQASADVNGRVTVSGVTDAQVTQYVYDEFSQLIAQTDAVGNALADSDAALYQRLRQELGYAALAGSLTAVQKQALRDLYTQRFAYDKLGRSVSASDNLGRTTSSAYDSLGRLVSVTDASGKVSTFAYDANGNIVRQTDANGRVAQIAYDSLNRLTQTTDALGVLTRRNYDNFGNLTSETRAFGGAESRTTSYQYDLNNRVTAVTDPQGATQRFEYDAVGNRLKVIDGRGNATQFVYDALNRNVKIIDPLNFETRYEYDGVGNRLTLVNARAGISRFEYDPGNQLVKTTDAEGRVSTFAYDVRGNRIEQRTAAGTSAEQLTRYEYDALGNLRRVTDALGGITDNNFDRVYNRTVVKDARGNTTTMAFDALNRTIQITDASGAITRFTYDGVGNTLSKTDALGRVTQYVYDANNRTIKEIAANGVETHYAYDAAGNRSSIKRAANTGIATTETFVYDKNNRLVSQTNALGQTTTYGYDVNGNCTQVTDAKGNLTQYAYDGNNRVIQITDPLDTVVRYVYDGNGNRTQVIDGRGGVSTSYYNANNEVTLTVDAEGGATSYTFDARGNVLSTTRHLQRLTLPVSAGIKPTVTGLAADQTTTFAYDKLNRVVERTDGEGRKIAYGYDAVGNQIWAKQSNSNGTDARTTNYGYDQLNRQTTITDPEGFSTTIEYDAAGNQTRVIHGRYLLVSGQAGYDAAKAARACEQSSTFAYDAANRLISMTDGVGSTTSYSYDAVGNRTTTTEASNSSAPRTTTHEYDKAGRLIKTTNPMGGMTLYSYDSAGNRVKEYVLQSNNGSEVWIVKSFEYDRNGRLTAEVAPDGVRTTYEYDATGNQITQKVAAGTAEERTTRKEYDLAGRVSAEVDALGNRTQYSYDSVGNRIKATDPLGRVARYYFDKSNNLVSILDAEGYLNRFSYNSAGKRTGETVYMTKYSGSVSDLTAPTPVVSSLDRSSGSVYDGNGRVIERTDTSGNKTTYTLDAAGNVTREVQFANTSSPRTLQYVYDRNNRLTTFTDVDGTVTTFTYDGANNKTSQNITSTTDPNALRKTVFEYDLNNRLVKETFDPAGLNFVQTLEYDKAGNVIKKTDANGHAARFIYDLNNRVVFESNGMGDNTLYAYDAAGNCTAKTDANGNTTTYVYDRNNRLVSETGPSVTIYTLDKGKETRSLILSHTYDAVGNETQTVDASGFRTTRYYDKNNRLIAEINGDNVLRQWSYNAAGNQLSETLFMTRVGDAAHNPAATPAAPSGEARTTVFEYDKSGRKTRITYSAVEVTTLSGTTGASPTATVATVQPQERFVYDALGNLVEAFDRNGNRTVSYYDIKGRVVAQVDPQGYLSEYYYDAQDNVLERRQYAGALNPASISSSSRPSGDGTTGIQTRYSYDAASRLIKERAPLIEVMDPATKYLYYECVETQYAYDKVGNQISKTLAAGSAQEITEYSYFDAANRRVALIDGNRVVTLFGYDANGNQTLVKRLFNAVASGVDLKTLSGSSSFATLAGTNPQDQEVTRLYDALNRLSSETELMGFGSADDLKKSFGYDANGNRTSTVDPDGVVKESRFNALGKVVKEIASGGSGNLYTYDAAGNEISVFTGLLLGAGSTAAAYIGTIAGQGTSGNIGFTVETRYNALNARIATNADDGLWREFGVDANGNALVTRNYGIDRTGTPILTMTAYDGRNREIARFAAAAPVAGEASPRRAVIRLQYDVNDRITQETDANGKTIYRTWDSLGSQLTEKNQMGMVTSTFKYDRLGHRTAETDALGNTRYSHYDKAGNLVKEVDGEGKVTNYLYDVFGRRTKVTNALNQSVTLNYDQRDRVISSTDALGHITYYGYDVRNNRTSSDDFSKRSVNTTVKLNNTQAASVVGDLRLALRPAGSTGPYVIDVSAPKTSFVAGTTVPKGDNINFSLVLPQYVDELRAVKVWTPVQVWVGDGESGYYATQYQWVYPYSGSQNQVIRAKAAELGINLTTYDQAFKGQSVSVGDGENTTYYYAWTANLLSNTEKLRDLLIAMGQSASLQAAASNPDYTTDYHYYTLNDLPVEVASYEVKVYGRNAAGQEVVFFQLASYTGQEKTVSTSAAGPALTLVNNSSTDIRDLRVYDAFGRVVDIMTHQNGQEIHERKTFDGNGNLIAEVDGAGRITTSIYGEFGRLVQVVDPGGRITNYEYDDQGRQKREYCTVTGKDIRRAFDDAGRLTEINDLGTGVRTVYTYDIAGNRMSEAVTTPENANNRSVSYQYDAVGQMVRWIDSVTGMNTNYAFDAAGNLAKAYTDVGYDPERTNTNYATVLSQVEAELRAVKVWQLAPSGQVWVSEGEGGHWQTTYSYQWVYPYTGSQNEVIRKKAAELGINLAGYDQAFKYQLMRSGDGEYANYYYAWTANLLSNTFVLHDLLSAMGYNQKLTTVVNNTNFRLVDHSYIYNKNNLMTQVNQGGVLESQYGYDDAGNRIMYNSKGTITSYTYDGNGRVTSSSVGGKTTGRWEYDQMGNVIKFTTYNADGITAAKVTTKKYYENGRNYFTDSAGQKTTLTLDLSGRTTTTQVVNGSTTYTYTHAYNSAGLETSITGSGGSASGTTVSTYNANDKLLTSNKSQGSGMSRAEVMNFVYNNDGQILYKFHDTGVGSDIFNTKYAYANGHAVGQTGNTKEKPNVTLLDSGNYSLVQNIGENVLNGTTTFYSARRGDTLQSIAYAYYGNASLWFVLADANNLDPTVPLSEGQRIEVPNTVKTGRTTATTHAVYKEGEIIGSTLPNLKTPPPKKGCGSGLAIIIVAVVAVVASIVTFGAAAVVAGMVFSTTLAAASTGVVLASFAIAGAVVGAIASAIQQGLFMALGYQDKFSWKSLASGAVSGAFSGAAQGFGYIASGLAAAQKGGEIAAKTAETIKYAKIAARAMQVASAASKQLMDSGKITSWAGLAAAAVAPVKGGVDGDGNMVTLVEALGDGTAWGTALEYVTPWLGVAESYVRTGKASPATWMNAVGSTLGKTGLGETGGLVAGAALSLMDKKAGRDYFANYVGNKIGNYIGAGIGSGIQGGESPSEGWQGVSDMGDVGAEIASEYEQDMSGMGAIGAEMARGYGLADLGADFEGMMAVHEAEVAAGNALGPDGWLARDRGMPASAPKAKIRAGGTKYIQNQQKKVPARGSQVGPTIKAAIDAGLNIYDGPSSDGGYPSLRRPPADYKTFRLEDLDSWALGDVVSAPGSWDVLSFASQVHLGIHEAQVARDAAANVKSMPYLERAILKSESLEEAAALFKDPNRSTAQILQRGINHPIVKSMNRMGTFATVGDIIGDSIDGVKNLPEGASNDDIIKEVIVQSAGSVGSSVGMAGAVKGGALLGGTVGGLPGAAAGGIIGGGLYLLGVDDYVEKVTEKGVRWFLSTTSKAKTYEWSGYIAP